MRVVFHGVMTFDLHTHSSVSDGTQPPAEVVAAAAANGLDGLALTDHDTTAGWQEAIQSAAEHQIALIPGMEITARTDNWISVHLLSYLHDPNYAPLAEAVAEVRDGRISRAQQMAELLAEDFPLTWESVLDQVSPGATIGRPHLADALVAAGVVADRNQAFAQYLHPSSKYYVSQYSLEATEAVQLVRAAGGVPVIAHAMASARGRTVSMNQLHQMVDAGLAGVEVRHRDNPENGRWRLTELAQQRQLLVTGSSDYHGAGKPNLLGENTTPRSEVDKLVEQATGSPAYGLG